MSRTDTPDEAHLRELVREAHAAVHDLRTVVADYRRVRAEVDGENLTVIRGAYSRMVLGQIEAAFTAGTDAYERRLNELETALRRRLDDLIRTGINQAAVEARGYQLMLRAKVGR